ncbi:MAG: hypothetical protein IKA48_13385 [Fibrobacter sp.]|nr:hypothetical protein [Fibrobacter sp.]
MTTAKKDNNATAKVKKGEELLAVLKELLADGAKILESVSALVLSRLIKSPYKIYFLNIPYFMRVRKRLDAEKIRKIG